MLVVKKGHLRRAGRAGRAGRELLKYVEGRRIVVRGGRECSGVVVCACGWAWAACCTFSLLLLRSTR